MPDKRRAPTALKEPETAVDQFRGLPDSIGLDAACGEFDRKRDPVQPAANLSNDRRFLIV